jgi:hypothetical protein
MLFAASVAAWERLIAGEASTLALWIAGLWAVYRLSAWVFRRQRPPGPGSVSLSQLFAAAFRRTITRAERS